MTRLVRRIAAIVALCALGFSQIAAAAHACAQAAEQRAAMSQGSSSHDCCDEKPTPCEQHCAYNVAPPLETLAVVAVASLQPLPALRVEPVAWREPASRAPERPERRLGPPPLKLFGFLRI